MKKKNAVDEDPLDREIDFSKGRRNPYFVEFHGPKAIRVLDADLAEIFPDEESVNAALRSVAASARKKVSAPRVVARKERR